MPMYDFRCTMCDHVQMEIMTVAVMEDPETKRVCKNCGGVSKKTFTVNNSEFLSPEALGRRKANSDFRNMLSIMKKAHPGSVIRDH